MFWRLIQISITTAANIRPHLYPISEWSQITAGSIFKHSCWNIVMMFLKEKIKAAIWMSNLLLPTMLMPKHMPISKQLKWTKKFCLSVKHQIPQAGFRSTENNWSLSRLREYQFAYALRLPTCRNDSLKKCSFAQQWSSHTT